MWRTDSKSVLLDNKETYVFLEFCLRHRIKLLNIEKKNSQLNCLMVCSENFSVIIASTGSLVLSFLRDIEQQGNRLKNKGNNSKKR